ncbi:gliding motility protein GldC [Chryseosolibacter indicus]|uniref:Gliding motility protein GldC n=1 Tax=Chryseosolibacter indicus TaxID=2782351 RepID=A0ABS5VTF6_9BACT|nr:gliding motility protein GldC [Chryseosolibacter indicus]MBT1704688.1 gliding motility protein GldC [Chryseosolibacter indicus]
MKKSSINFTVHLDQNNIPEKIQWDATDKPDPQLSETKSISVALWDSKQKNTLRIDLWTKDMPVEEMKRFFIDCIGGLAQSILTSTGDEYMASETNALCEKLVKHLQEENK